MPENRAIVSLKRVRHRHVYVLQVNAQGEKKVAAVLDDGRKFEGDLLIGADGIWSKVQHNYTTVAECSNERRS